MNRATGSSRIGKAAGHRIVGALMRLDTLVKIEYIYTGYIHMGDRIYMHRVYTYGRLPHK